MSKLRIDAACLTVLLASLAVAAKAADGNVAFFESPEMGLRLRALWLQASIVEQGVRDGKLARVGPQASQSNLSLWRGSETGVFTSDLQTVNPFNRAVMSWNADGDAKFELEVDGKWHVMGKWSDEPRSSSTDDVDVDTLILRAKARAFRYRVTASPGTTVTLVAVTTWVQGDRNPVGRERSPAWGTTLNVPQRSQGVEANDPGKICSPTSLSMVLAFHGVVKPTAVVAEGVMDHASGLYGNWPFNTAYAHRIAGFEAYVQRMMGFEEIEKEIAAGNPVILSHRFEVGDLDNAPISHTNGHIIVVVGFTKTGDVVVNDPAARQGAVRRIYKRDQLTKTWLERGSGIVYVVHPKPAAR